MSIQKSVSNLSYLDLGSEGDMRCTSTDANAVNGVPSANNFNSTKRWLLKVKKLLLT